MKKSNNKNHGESIVLNESNEKTRCLLLGKIKRITERYFMCGEMRSVLAESKR